jgi:hypothetical protein
MELTIYIILGNAQNIHGAQQVHYNKAQWIGLHTMRLTSLYLVVVHHKCMYHSPIIFTTERLKLTENIRFITSTQQMRGVHPHVRGCCAFVVMM